VRIPLLLGNVRGRAGPRPAVRKADGVSRSTASERSAAVLITSDVSTQQNAGKSQIFEKGTELTVPFGGKWLIRLGRVFVKTSASILSVPVFGPVFAGLRSGLILNSNVV
jgi:hypothetical protein